MHQSVCWPCEAHVTYVKSDVSSAATVPVPPRETCAACKGLVNSVAWAWAHADALACSTNLQYTCDMLLLLC